MYISDKSDPTRYMASGERYRAMKYRRCGESGILLPEISLGLWHNFGFVDNPENARKIARRAFDLGITHFDLANNYGPPYGSAEETFGMILRRDLQPYRDELIISTKAGYEMWDGPYGNFGSRKYLIASLDQSLKRMGIDYVDIFYHHRPDLHTPLEETMLALDQVVRQGKALYAGISNYNAELTAQAEGILRELRTPFLIHQGKYSLLERSAERSLLSTLDGKGIGMIAFSPLAQGMLSDRYLEGIPADSRAGREMTFLDRKQVEARMDIIGSLNRIASARGQKLNQLAISWILRDPRVTSVLIGASSPEQLDDNVKSLGNTSFTEKELEEINELTAGEPGI